jgi:uncharacterized membrane protein
VNATLRRLAPYALLLTVALSVNLYTSITEIPANQNTDNNADVYNSQMALEHGWYPRSGYGQSWTSFVVGWIVPKATPIFDGKVTNVYRYLLPVLFSVTPLLLYALYKRYVTPKQALLGAMFFTLLPPTWQEVTTRGKSEIAEPLAVATILVALGKLPDKVRIPVGIILTALTLWAHYTVGIMLLIWLFTMLVVSENRLAAAVTLFAGTTFLFGYFNWADQGGLMTQILAWGALEHPVDQMTAMILPFQQEAMIATIPEGTDYVLNGMSAIRQLSIRAAVYSGLIVMGVGALCLATRHEFIRDNRELSAWITGSAILVACALFVPFFTKGLYLSAWIQINAIGLSLLFGAATSRIPLPIPYIVLAGLVFVSLPISW